MDTATSSGGGNLSVEIGHHYAIIGMDGHKIEVIGKRVSDIDTDVYIHYEGTDKRLDEWVDVQRILPLKGPPSGSDSQAPADAPAEDTDSKDIAQQTETNARPKRKIVRDEVTLLVESLASPFRKRTGAVGSGNASKSSNNSPGPGKHLDDDDDDLERVRNVEWILYAGYDIATWYYSPFPEEYHDCQRLFVCDYCLKYIRHVDNYVDHTRTCKRKRPPGVVVYSKGVNKIYKVDGSKEKLYCQNLSLLAKLFLDNKTLYFDVNGFHFFVLTETRAGDRSDVPVGFFSKETVSYDGYNLACILVLPPFQRKSYGKLLIEFSYELTKIEGKVGSPEKPLSDLGKLGYVSYWVTAILRELYPKPWPAKRLSLLPLSGKSRNRATSLKPGSQSTASPSVPPSAGPSLSSPSSSSIPTPIPNDTASPTPLTAVKEEPPSQSTSLVRTGHQNTLGPMDMELNSGPFTSLSNGACLSTTDREKDEDKEIAFSIRELASKTGIMEEDLLETLVTMGWMKHWLPPKVHDSHPPVKGAKRNYHKLMKFHEQQRLLDAYGNPQDSGHEGHGNELSEHRSHQHVRQEHPSQHSQSSAAPKEPAGHAAGGEHASSLTGIRRYFTSSASSGANSGAITDNTVGSYKSKSTHSTPEANLSTLEYLEQQRKALLQEFDPVAILEIPESEDEDDNEHKKENSVSEDDDFQAGSSQHSQSQQHKQHQSHHTSRYSSHQHHGPSLLSHSDLNPVDVAVVTMGMVKAYQDKFNIRLDPYIDRDAIDWSAYHKSLGP